MLNLLPDDYIEKQMQRRANRMCLVLFIVVMSGIIGAAIVSEQSGRHTQQILERIEVDFAEAAKRIEQMHILQAQKRAMLHKAKLTATLQERVPRSYLLAVLTNARPENTSLTEFSLRAERNIVSMPKGGKASKFAQAKQKHQPPKPMSVTMVMQVTGLASTDVEVARFIANLARNPLLVSVDLLYSQEKVIDGAKVREFQVELRLKRDADALDVLPAADEDTGKTGKLARAGMKTGGGL